MVKTRLNYDGELCYLVPSFVKSQKKRKGRKKVIRDELLKEFFMDFLFESVSV